MKQCPKCSSQNPGDARFCKGCGSSLEGVPDNTKTLSAAASDILNKAGNLLIEGSKKIGTSTPNEAGSQTADPPLDTLGDGVESTADSPEFLPPQQSTWKNSVAALLHQKRLWIAVAAFAVVIAVIAISSGGKAKRLIGTWKIQPEQTSAFGISLDVDKNTIVAQGDYLSYCGKMIFDYKIVSNSELVLQYDWTFDQWPWSFPYANEIPLRYSVSEDGTVLTLIWSGTSLVLLDDTHNMGYFGSYGYPMTNGSITFTKVK